MHKTPGTRWVLQQGRFFLATAVVGLLIATVLHVWWQTEKNDAAAFWAAVVFAGAFCSAEVWFTLSHLQHQTRPLRELMERVDRRLELFIAQEDARGGLGPSTGGPGPSTGGPRSSTEAGGSGR